VWGGKPPPCPRPTDDVVRDVGSLMLSRNGDSLVIWISEMERYCEGIDAMRR